MRVLGIVGPDPAAATLVERLTDRLSEQGRVATVERAYDESNADGDGATHPRGPRTGAAATYELTDDGDWFAAGRERTLADTLDDLAPDYEYALVVGFTDATVPTVALGEVDHAGEAIATAAEPAEFDPDEILAALGDVEPYETLESLVADVKASPVAEYAGAIATFTGRVRRKDHADDPPTEFLEFEKYEGLAADRMATIREELTERDGVHAVRLHHRTGVVEAGEDIVFVVVLAGHRGEAFSAVEDGIDRLKDEVPLFKKEVTVEDTFWAHERHE